MMMRKMIHQAKIHKMHEYKDTKMTRNKIQVSATCIINISAGFRL